MATTENRPDHTGENGRTVESVLQTVTQDLKRLHQDLITQLSQEVTQLQAEKARLTNEVRSLQSERQTLQTQNAQSLSQQQLAQQELWAKKLALAISDYLKGLMMQQISQTVKTQQPQNGGSNLADTQAQVETAHRLLASLDASFSATFSSLQQELGSYQSSLYRQLNEIQSQQLAEMQNLGQQGEAILDALVNRLRQQLQTDSVRSSPAVEPPTHYRPIPQENGNPAALGLASSPQPYPLPPNSLPPRPTDSYHGSPGTQPQLQGAEGYRNPAEVQSQLPLTAPASALPTPPASPAPPAKRELSNFWAGLILVLLSTIALSVHNVVVRVIGTPSSIFGFPDVGGFIDIKVLGNSLLILWLRMLIVLPLMVVVAMFLYPPIWRDLKKFFLSGDHRPIFNVVGSGFFLFLSQVLIYIAIGKIGAGPAVTILFMYPIVTVPLAWLLFGDRPTSLRWGVMGVILTGIILTAQPSMAATSRGWSFEGVIFAVGSGIAFALYLIFMQLGFKKLHPIPVSLVQFFTIFVLSAVILIALGPDLGVQVLAEQRTGFVLSGILLGVLTLVGYLTNNLGVRFMGAGLASIIASIGPVMTAFLARILIQNQLQPIQWFGILLVTLGVGALSFERMRLQTRKK